LARPGLGQQGALTDKLDAVLRAAVERGDVAGVVGAITDANDTIYSAAFGERKLGSGVAMTEDTVCNMASMTKPIAGACAMQLVEQGKLDFESPITKWFPEAAQLQVLAGWEGDKPVLRPPVGDITLRHLMTHTSGMASLVWNADLVRYGETIGGLPLVDYEKPETWVAQPLVFDPGTRWHYGPGIDWTGRLVVELTGKSLGTVMRENIFEPLGMTHTGYAVTPEMTALQSSIHRRAGDGTIILEDMPPQAGPVREYGSGGLNGNTPDYLRFIRMILNSGSGNGNQLLKPETVANMSQNHMGDIRVEMLKTANPSISLDAEFFPGLPKSWGYTFMINEEQAPTGRPAGSLAWAGGVNTFFWIDPTNGIGGVFMSQLRPFVDTKTLQTFYDFETAYYDAVAT
jgi:CubicO group peptidase (beta-lactamase class C family)